MIERRASGFRAGLLASAVIAFSAPAHAQSVPAQPLAGDAAPGAAVAQSATASDASSGGIGDIVVTAQRRVETLGTVPVAATVVGGEEWAKSLSFSVEDLEKISPSLTFDSTTSARNNSVRIRGIGTNTTSSGIEPSTSTVIDGVVLIRSGQSSSAQLLDLERIEVLRGPQGTLFGKNASAGVVNVVTANPSREFGINADALATDDEEYQFRATATGPITESLSGRISGFYRNFDGNVTNVRNGSRLNGAKSFGVRGKLLFDPGGGSTALLTVDYGRTKSNCCARPINRLNLAVPATVAGFGRAAVERPFLGVNPTFDNRQVDNDTPSKDNSRSLITAAEINLALGNDFTLTSISAYQRYTISQQLDDDQTGNAPVAGGQTFKQVILSDEKTDGVTQELRLTSPLWGPVDFVAGLYYFDASVLQTSSNARRRVAVPQNQLSTFTSKTNFLNYAAFGQVNLHPFEGVTVLLGGRFTHDKVDNLYNRVDDPVAPFRSGSTNYNLSQSSDDFSWKGGLQYKASRDAFFYATYAQGYKGPGFNVASNGTTADPPVRPETAESYEVGTKIKLFDRRLALNIALFDAKYRDFAVTAVDTVTNSVRLVNAATLKTRGVEVEGELRPVRGLSITGAVGYIDSAITVLGTPCYDLQTAATGCTVRPVVGRLQDVVDGAVPNAAKWKWNIGASWEIPVGGLNIIPRANYSWTGRQQFLLNQNPDGIQGGFGILDAGIAVSTADDRYTIEVFVKNALDRFYVNSVGNVSDLPGSTFSFIPRDADRYFGLRLSARL